MKTQSAFDCVRKILDERHQNPARELTQTDRESIAEIANRQRMLVRGNPETEVTLSPYMLALMKLERI